MPAKSTPTTRKPPSAQRFTRALLGWYRKNARDLPWRRTRDPYEVIVSEFMLQQTQVSRVLEYYPRFLKRFPTVYKLAAAKPKAVMESWEGLGYYARASNLHALTRVVSEHHNGKIPSDPEELIKLPGVGRYTAGAVASFAYEKPVPAVDTNVARVIERYFTGKRETRNGKRTNQIWAIAGTIVPKNGRRAWAFNQAIMELGARICVARKPRCPECPVKRGCRATAKLSRQ
ncbi:MAG TPA: A/G-specific adenine glycosylase [Gemmatimonadales bacterium]|nr:A/G-specific adenine glycosylase [Gemmatimonadales bacterium]